MEKQRNNILAFTLMVLILIVAFLGLSSDSSQTGVRKVTNKPQLRPAFAPIHEVIVDTDADREKYAPSSPTPDSVQKEDALSLTTPSSQAGSKWDNVACPNTTDPCDLTDMTYGVPVILVSAGRSGTSVTWNLMSELSVPENHYHQMAFEDLGGSTFKTERQLDALWSEHGKCWLERAMCYRQFTNMGDDKGSAIYGPKWKTSSPVFKHPKAQQALEWLGDTPAVRVVYNTRNILDMLLSRFKHDFFPNLTSHCNPDDNECINEHKEAEKSMVVPTGRKLIKKLEGLEKMNNFTEKLLNKYHVPRIHVEYDKLYYSGEDMSEWERLFKFLGVGPEHVTAKDITDHMARGATSAERQADKMANYDEVVKTLKDTRFEKLLRD